MNERCNRVARCSCYLLDLRANRTPDDQHRSASHDDWAHDCCIISACVSGRQPAGACHNETSRRRHAPRKLTRRGHTWMAHSAANCNMETQAKEQHHSAPCAIERRLVNITCMKGIPAAILAAHTPTNSSATPVPPVEDVGRRIAPSLLW